MPLDHPYDVAMENLRLQQIKIMRDMFAKQREIEAKWSPEQKSHMLDMLNSWQAEKQRSEEYDDENQKNSTNTL